MEELPGNRTRFVQRNTAMVEVSNKLQMAIVVGLIWGWSSGVMQTRMCDVIKALAEGKKFIQFLIRNLIVKEYLMKKTPLFYISPALLVSVSLIGIGYAALHSFLNKNGAEAS